MFNGQAFRLPGLWCCLGPVPLGKGSSPSLGISEVLLGTASGIHRCPGLRVGGGEQIGSYCLKGTKFLCQF